MLGLWSEQTVVTAPVKPILLVLSAVGAKIRKATPDFDFQRGSESAHARAQARRSILRAGCSSKVSTPSAGQDSDSTADIDTFITDAQHTAPLSETPEPMAKRTLPYRRRIRHALIMFRKESPNSKKDMNLEA